MIELTGRLVYAPDRGDGFRKVGKLKTLILELQNCEALGAYCRKMITEEYGPWCNLAPPLFGMHVTIIRGHGDKFDPELPRYLTRQKMSVFADPSGLGRTPWAKGSTPGFWTLPVKSNAIWKIREQLYVKPIFPFHPHLTIGRENVAFMHAKAPKNVLAVATKVLGLIPNAQRKSKDEETGNAQLKAELVSFIGGFRFKHPLCTGEELMKLISRHITLPAQKEWERKILAEFHYEGLIT